MKKYEVLVPFAGFVMVEVEARSEEEAKKKGFVTAFNTGVGSYFVEGRVEEVEFYETLVDGNVVQVNDYEIRVQEIVN